MAVSESALIEAGIEIGLVPADLMPAMRLEAKRERLRLLEVVTRGCRFPETALYQAIADLRKIPFIQPRDLKADGEAMELLPKGSRQQRPMLPIIGRGGQRLLVLADPDDRLSVERVERATGLSYNIALSDPLALKTALEQYNRSRRGAGPVQVASEEADPVELLNDVMKEVYLRRASDVHYEPMEEGMRIRMRVDGQMQEYSRLLSKSEEEGLLNRIKVLSGLDIAEQRMAQDGAMKYTIENWNIPEVDIRVATIPSRWGERGTMRILGEETGLLSLEELGMPERMLTDFRGAINRPHGIILVTGPTGSGKSTTLYGAIRELDIDNMNVLTVEDPVEQTIEGISQVQVSTKVSFAQALRSFLRHDPDVILVGEIRDQETVEIGLRSAMTGHLVLSTLHTNDSIGAVSRLVDVGAERFLIGSTLVGVLAQRLARRLCHHCRVKRPATKEEVELLGDAGREGLEIYDPGGCSFCLGSGYKGRVGIFEAFWVTRDLTAAIADGVSEAELRNRAKSLTTLWMDAYEKIVKGDVALADVQHLRTEAD